MKEIIKQCVGIDVSKKDFTVSFCVLNIEYFNEEISSRKFTNESSGFKAFNKWVGKLIKKSIPLSFVMEATGTYHERLAYFLFDLGCNLSIVQPKRAKDFARSSGIKKINDPISSKYLAMMGLEKRLPLWKKPQQKFLILKRKTREKERIQGMITEIKNQIHAENSGHIIDKGNLKRMNEMLKLLTKQKAGVIKEINEFISKDEELSIKIKNVTSIPGVGVITAATLIGETDGFSQTNNKRQLVSYAGLDVINHESGTSVKTKARISKRGNKNIRKSLHMPALTSIRAKGSNQELFKRLVSKTGIKMKGVVAVQRKLLVLVYTLWKNDMNYDPNFEEKERGNLSLPQELELVRSNEN